jgi:TolB-like protein
LLYVFEDFTLDTGRRELRRGAARVPISPQAFDLLEYLIQNRGRVLSKDDLITSIWDGRVVSESALSTRINAARCAIGDSGDNQRLIRTVPRKGFRFVGEVREENAGAASAAAATETAMASTLALPDRPSIAVLPFTNMSGDPTRDYFADGMTEDIITELSRMRWLFVIARNSTFTYKGRAVDVKQVARELGVRYVLEGSARQAGDRVRITAQLIDAGTGVHIWANRFDGQLEDIFDLQDRVTANIICAIAPKLEEAEIERAKHKPTENLNAYDCFMRGMASFHQYTNEANNEALRLFHRVMDLDPDFASAYGMAAQCYVSRHTNRWMNDRLQEYAEAVRLARHAIELGWGDAVALCNGGYVLGHLGRDPDAGAAFIDRARALNPNLASAWSSSGWMRIFLGDPETAIAHFAHVMRLSQLDPRMAIMQAGTASAHFFAGRSNEAALWAERALREKPNWLLPLRIAAASSALAGRVERAQEVMTHLRELDPAFRISNFKDLVPFARAADLARYEEGLRIAGLPE